jgi:HEAT repeat protein
VLGCGLLGDGQSVPDLIKKLGDVTKVSQAACLALINIDTKAALEGVASALLRGNEQLRRAAAEAFSSHPMEGFPILKDGSSIDDLMTRRAVIYGLRKVDEPWAIEILENLQVEDPQWVIKDSASQALEDIRNLDPAIPSPQTALDDIPWLIEFAGERGVGISKGKSARDMLLRVVEEGSEELILAALGQIQKRGIIPSFPTLYTLYYGENENLREESFSTMWLISSMGFSIPPLSHVGI